MVVGRSASITSLITSTSTNLNMRLTDEVFLIPFQTAAFEEQERQLSERTSRVTAQLGFVFSGRNVDQFLDNTLASAWYSMHRGDLDRYTQSGDEVGVGTSTVYYPTIKPPQSSDGSPELPTQRRSSRKRLSSSRLTTPGSSISKPSPSRPPLSKVASLQKHASSPFISNGHWTRKMLQAQWDKATKEAGSAPVTIVNEVDGEEVPGVPEDFQYFEHGYDWGSYAPDRNFLIGCDCPDNCSGVNTGKCCINSDRAEETTGFWYDERVRSPSPRTLARRVSP